jgi:hypothetical protein
MAGKTFVALGAAALLMGCGETSEAINASFDENFVSSCVSSATGSGVPANLAEAACDCALTEINAKYSATEKLTLSDAQAMPIAEQCFTQVMGAAS